MATLPAGTTNVTLQFPGEDIFHSNIDGPYTIADVVLSTSDDLNILDEVTNLATTTVYQANRFAHYPVEIDSRAFTDTAEDTTGDGKYDKLLVNGSVRVDTAGSYAINARLLSKDGTELVQTQQTMTLSAGRNNFTLDFNWDGIRTVGIDGPYTVADLSIYPTFNADGLGFLTAAYTTAPYPASGGQANGRITGTVYCAGYEQPYVNVTVYGVVYETGQDGTFEFVDIPPGEHVLTAASSIDTGCTDQEETVTVTSGQVTYVEVHLGPK